MVMGRFTMVCVLCALVGVHSAVAFSRVVVRIFEGSNNFPALHFPRTDAAECDSHFYVLFSLGKLSLEDFRRRVIDTVLYRGQLFGFSIYLFIFVHAGEDIARWGTTGPTDRRSLFGIGYGLLSTLRLETRAWLSACICLRWRVHRKGLACA